MPGDDTNKGSISSILLSAHNSNQIADALSAADEFWVNSILVNESDIADTDWSSMQKALLNILGSETDSVNTSATKADGILKSDNDSFFMHEEAENNEDDISKKKRHYSYKADNYSLGNVFKPGCADAIIENPDVDFGLGLELSEYDSEVSADDIFKVWDLKILQEKDEDKDELIQQLNSALAENSFKMAPSTSVDSKISIQLKDDDLDEIIAGITGLSLTQKLN